MSEIKSMNYPRVKATEATCDLSKDEVKPSIINQSISNLERVVNDLHDIWGRIHEKIEPVIRQEPHGPTDEKNIVKGNVGLAVRIDEIARHVENIRVDMDETFRLIEL